MSTSYTQASEDYTRIEQAIHYLQENYQRQPELEEVASALGLSEYHFQRLFTRWAGISPKRFVQFLTKENAKTLLQHASVLEAAYASGLSGPGRLHDLLIHTEGVSPGEYKSQGAGLTIQYGIHPTPFGQALIGLTARGICHLSFIQGDPQEALAALRQQWPQADLLPDQAATEKPIPFIFTENSAPANLSLHLNGTNFQLKVWEALLRIPAGQITSYEEIALAIGHPRSMRAVGNAVGQNPIAYLIPCHRVLRKTGTFGNYRWGVARKQALLAWELLPKTEETARIQA